MKFSVAILATAGLVAAQDLSGLPKCAQTCIKAALPKAGCDSADDAECLCSEKSLAKISEAALPCLTKECDASELLKAQEAAGSICSDLSGSGSASASSPASTAVEVSTTVAVDQTKTATTPVVPTPGNNSTATKTKGSGSKTTGGSGDDSDDASGTGSAPSATNSDSAAGMVGPVTGALLAVFAAALAL